MKVFIFIIISAIIVYAEPAPSENLCETCGDLTLEDIAARLMELDGLESNRRAHIVEAMGIAPAVRKYYDEITRLIKSKSRGFHLRNNVEIDYRKRKYL